MAWQIAALALLVAIIHPCICAPVNEDTALDVYNGGTSEGCYYNFQHYGEGDRIMTNEPCLNCTCHRGMLVCYLRVCPFTKPAGRDCTVEKRGDQCCPVVTCPDVPVDLLTSTSPSSLSEYGASEVGHPDPYGCTIDGQYFSEGSKVSPTPDKPCELCYCIRNMTACVLQECTLHVDGCTPVYRKDTCCPVRYSCDHPEDHTLLLDDFTTTLRPTPGFLLTTTSFPITQECIHDNNVYADGALIKTDKACEHCYCMKGDIVCVVQECGTPMENEGKNCTAIAPRAGQCCPDTYVCNDEEERKVTTQIIATLETGTEVYSTKSNRSEISPAEHEIESIMGHGNMATESPKEDEFEISTTELGVFPKSPETSTNFDYSSIEKITHTIQNDISTITNSEKLDYTTTDSNLIEIESTSIIVANKETPTNILNNIETTETYNDIQKNDGSETTSPNNEETSEKNEFLVTKELENVDENGTETPNHSLEINNIIKHTSPSEQITTSDYSPNILDQDESATKSSEINNIGEGTIKPLQSNEESSESTFEISTNEPEKLATNKYLNENNLQSTLESSPSPTEQHTSENLPNQYDLTTEHVTLIDDYVRITNPAENNEQISAKTTLESISTPKLDLINPSTETEAIVTVKSEDFSIVYNGITEESQTQYPEFTDLPLTTENNGALPITKHIVDIENHNEVTEIPELIKTDLPEEKIKTDAENSDLITPLQTTTDIPKIKISDISTHEVETKTPHEELNNRDEQIDLNQNYSKSDGEITSVQPSVSSGKLTPVTENVSFSTNTLEQSTKIISTTNVFELESSEITTEPSIANIDQAENEIHEEDVDKEHIPILSHIPGEGDCLVDDITYSNDSDIPLFDKCQKSCRCISSIVKCENIECSPPPSNMVNCQSVADDKNNCCPIYVCDNNKPTFIPETENQITELTTPKLQTCKSDQCTDDQITETRDEPNLSLSDSEHSNCEGNNCLQDHNISNEIQCSDGNCLSSNIKPQECKSGDCEVTEPSDVLNSKLPEVVSETNIAQKHECNDQSCVNIEDHITPEPQKVDSLSTESMTILPQNQYDEKNSEATSTIKNQPIDKLSTNTIEYVETIMPTTLIYQPNPLESTISVKSEDIVTSASTEIRGTHSTTELSSNQNNLESATSPSPEINISNAIDTEREVTKQDSESLHNFSTVSEETDKVATSTEVYRVTGALPDAVSSSTNAEGLFVTLTDNKEHITEISKDEQSNTEVFSNTEEIAPTFGNKFNIETTEKSPPILEENIATERNEGPIAESTTVKSEDNANNLGDISSTSVETLEVTENINAYTLASDVISDKFHSTESEISLTSEANGLANEDGYPPTNLESDTAKSSILNPTESSIDTYLSTVKSETTSETLEKETIVEDDLAKFTLKPSKEIESETVTSTEVLQRFDLTSESNKKDTTINPIDISEISRNEITTSSNTNTDNKGHIYQTTVKYSQEVDENQPKQSTIDENEGYKTTIHPIFITTQRAILHNSGDNFSEGPITFESTTDHSLLTTTSDLIKIETELPPSLDVTIADDTNGLLLTTLRDEDEKASIIPDESITENINKIVIEKNTILPQALPTNGFTSDDIKDDEIHTTKAIIEYDVQHISTNQPQFESSTNGVNLIYDETEMEATTKGSIEETNENNFEHTTIYVPRITLVDTKNTEKHLDIDTKTDSTTSVNYDVTTEVDDRVLFSDTRRSSPGNHDFIVTSHSPLDTETEQNQGKIQTELYSNDISETTLHSIPISQGSEVEPDEDQNSASINQSEITSISPFDTNTEHNLINVEKEQFSNEISETTYQPISQSSNSKPDGQSVHIDQIEITSIGPFTTKTEQSNINVETEQYPNEITDTTPQSISKTPSSEYKPSEVQSTDIIDQKDIASTKASIEIEKVTPESSKHTDGEQEPIKSTTSVSISTFDDEREKDISPIVENVTNKILQNDEVTITTFKDETTNLPLPEISENQFIKNIPPVSVEKTPEDGSTVMPLDFTSKTENILSSSDNRVSESESMVPQENITPEVTTFRFVGDETRSTTENLIEIQTEARRETTLPAVGSTSSTDITKKIDESPDSVTPLETIITGDKDISMDSVTTNLDYEINTPSISLHETEQPSRTTEGNLNKFESSTIYAQTAEQETQSNNLHFEQSSENILILDENTPEISDTTGSPKTKPSVAESVSISQYEDELLKTTVGAQMQNTESFTEKITDLVYSSSIIPTDINSQEIDKKDQIKTTPATILNTEAESIIDGKNEVPTSETKPEDQSTTAVPSDVQENKITESTFNYGSEKTTLKQQQTTEIVNELEVFTNTPYVEVKLSSEKPISTSIDNLPTTPITAFSDKVSSNQPSEIIPSSTILETTTQDDFSGHHESTKSIHVSDESTLAPSTTISLEEPAAHSEVFVTENAHAITEEPINNLTPEKTDEKLSTISAPVEFSKATTTNKPIDLPSPDEDLDHQIPAVSSPADGYGHVDDYEEEEEQTFGPGTCRYGGKVYVSAQQIPRDDPCDFCFCFRSDIICLQQSCPPPIHGCHEEPIQGFCCPRYECHVSMATTLNMTTTTTTTTTTLPPHFLPHAYKGAAQRRGCQIKGQSYQVGEVVRASSGPCLHCTCGGDGRMQCDPKVCTPEPMLRQMVAAVAASKRRR